MKGPGAYGPAEYRRRVAVHEDTLSKYLSQFGRWLGVWIARRPENVRLAQAVFGLDRLEEVLAGSEPAVSEVFRLAQAQDLSADFFRYFLGKTHLSYELKGSKPSPRSQEKNSHHGPYHDKLGEFVFIILAEYTVLHNYAFVGKLRGKNMNTIDKWMKPSGGRK